MAIRKKTKKSTIGKIKKTAPKTKSSVTKVRTVKKRAVTRAVRTIKKSHAKKHTTKKTVRAKKGKRVVVIAPVEWRFWVYFGPILENVYDLKSCFEIITDDQFCHHVTREKNDFAQWANDVLLDAKLSKKLLKSKTKKTSEKVVRGHIRDCY